MVRAFNLAILFVYFLTKVVVSGWSVAWAVLRGYRGDKWGTVRYHTTIESPWGVVLLFSIISMTPGSLSMDIDRERRVIDVHLLRESGRDDFLRITGRIERMIKRVFSEKPIKPGQIIETQ